MKRSRIRPVRPTLRRGEPTPGEKAEARQLTRDRASGHCQLCEVCDGTAILPLNGPIGVRGELVHLKSKRRFGWFENPATGQRHLWGCHLCHRYVHAGRKPCPPKPKGETS